MDLYKELSEVGEMQDTIQSQRDMILDLYFTDPKKAKKLLLELKDISQELENLNNELTKIQNEIS